MMAATTDSLASLSVDIQNLYKEIEMLNDAAVFDSCEAIGKHDKINFEEVIQRRGAPTQIVINTTAAADSPSSRGSQASVSSPDTNHSPAEEKSEEEWPHFNCDSSKPTSRQFTIQDVVQHGCSEHIVITVPTSAGTMTSALPYSPAEASGASSPDSTRPHTDLTADFTMASATTMSSKKSPSCQVVRYCQVCNDYASGFHYGAWSCEGCKAFFKRSIQGNVGPTDYVCPATNTCTIDKHRRKSCQACRLRKCLDVGMSRTVKPGIRREVNRHSIFKAKIKRPGTKIIDGTETCTKIKREPPSCLNPFIQAMMECDYTVGLAGHDHSVPPSETNIMDTITKLADRELIFTINWAKHVPGYTELPLNDQVSLLEMSWMELMTYEQCFRSVPYHGEKIAYSSDFILDRPTLKLAGIEKMGDILMTIIAKFDNLRLSREELICLKALSLVTSQTQNIEDTQQIHKMETEILEALHEAVTTNSFRDRFRMSRVLLMMPLVRYVSSLGVAHLFQLKDDTTIPLLLQEMVTAQFVAQHALRKDNKKF